MTELHPAVRDTARAALEVHALLEQAEQAQWQRSTPTISDEDQPDDPGIRSKGVTSDPVFDTVADTNRLRLRAAVINAEHALAQFKQAMAAVAYQLQRALDAWNGGH